MIEVVTIENALERINGDIFQELCNHYLYLKLNPNSITPIGSVIGKEKSKKGIPDCYFTSADNELIFAEYTTRERLKTGESFYKKLESDINSCFDKSKTGLENEEINKVILCFTERIKPNEKKELEKLCKSYNPACILELKGIRDLAFAVLDYPILGKYLGIKIGTGQIQEPSEFIANYEKSKISTPLSNSFLGREDEIEKGLINLDKSNILLVHGAAGTGKSKYAIELAKLYSIKNNFNFLCIGNKGIAIWEDLRTFIQIDKKYLLLVDDANRLAKNFQWILSLLENRDSNSLKIIVTVRDYALNQVKGISKIYDYSSVEINPFSDDDIKKIVQSDDFKINDPAYIDRILKISKGNARLAIMCAKVALKAKSILELEDASQIYDEYFEPLFDEINLLKDPITQKSLAIISFFSRIDKENREFCDLIFNNLNIDEDKFWEICYYLHESELVDLYEKQVVKISDQIFSTYIFYKVVVQNETLGFTFFLDNYLDYEHRITDTLIPVINTFNYKGIESKLKPIIVAKWFEIEKLGNYQFSLKFLDLFWFYLSPQVLIFLKRTFDKQEPEVLTEFKYTYELNEFSSGIEKELEILSRFRYHSDDFFKDSLELMFYYAVKFPSKMPAISYIIKEKFSFTRLGYVYGHHIQHLLFDFLIENAKSNSNQDVYENILAKVLPHYLKIEFRENEGNGRSITIYTFRLGFSKAIQAFRNKCFNYLLFEAKKSTVLKILSAFNFYEYRNSDSILKHDKRYIFSLIDKFIDTAEFEDCLALQHILEAFEWLKLEYSPNEYKSELFLLAEILKRNRQQGNELSWEDREKLYQKELLEYCKNFDFNKYQALFTNFSTILTKTDELNKGNLRWQYETSLNTILGNLALTDKDLFFNVLSLSFNQFRFNLNYSYIFNRFFGVYPQFYYELFELIQNLQENIKFCYHQTLNIDSVNDEHISFLYSDFIISLKSLIKKFDFWNLTFISKYKKLKGESEIYFEILNIVLDKATSENVKIGVGQQFVEKCLTFDDIPFEDVMNIYLHSCEVEQHFDYENDIFKVLTQRNSNAIVWLLTKRITPYHEKFDFIWSLDNYIDIIDSIFEYYINSKTFYFPESTIAVFFPIEKDKFNNNPVTYLKKLVNEKYSNTEYMNIVFNVICNKYPDLRMDFLANFLKLNSDFDMFRNLEITPNSHSWSGSYIPILENEKKVWEDVISVLNKLPNRLNYYEHKDYANQMIARYDANIKEEMKREFYDDFK